MLHLFDSPHWAGSQGRFDLPATLPVWTIACLVVQGDWVAREDICALFWPELGASAAQHNLRTNLYRVRALLAQWGLNQALQGERARVRLQLPCDVQALQDSAVGTGTGTGTGKHIVNPPGRLLAGMSFAGFPAFRAWVDDQQAGLQRRWRAAALACMQGDTPDFDVVQRLSQALMQADPLDDEALAHCLRALHARGHSTQARRLFGRYAEQLRQELGVEPEPGLIALAAGPTPAAAAGNSFVGRDVELAQLSAMLGQQGTRLVSLVGPGGVGKSRLARHLALQLAGRWRDGMAWVALADLVGIDGAWSRLALQLGLSLSSTREVRSQLVEALSSRQMLIVLDNAEHLPGLAAGLAPLMAASAGSTFLVTSRSPLEMAGERGYTLEGLSHPGPQELVTGPEHALAYDAFALLAARVRDAAPGVDIAGQWQDALALVRATGGWPLAIELAAVGLAHEGAATLLSALQASVQSLAAGRPPDQARHASMGASLALSWRLLSDDEQAALAACSVFRGGFDRAAALEVARCDGELLARLIARSLLQSLGGGRLSLHPLVAQYASERLTEDAAHRHESLERHRRLYGRRLQACAEAPTRQMPALLQAMEVDFENHRMAWLASVSVGDSQSLTDGSAALSEFGTARGRARELSGLVAAAMPASKGNAAARCALLQASANLHYRCADLDAAVALARDGLVAAAASGQAAAQRSLLNTLALALKDLGRYEEAEVHARDGLQQARVAGMERDVAIHSNTCAILAKTRGEHDTAAQLYEEALAIHRRHANHRSAAVCLNNLGNVHRARHDETSAQRCFEECLRLAELHGIASTRAFALVNLAQVHLARGGVALARAFATRAAAEPAAENAVLLTADAVLARAAIAAADFDAARRALGALASRARSTGLHAAMLEAVASQARLLAAQGRRGDALQRYVFLLGMPQLPAMARDDVQQGLAVLAATAPECEAAQTGGLELELLLDEIQADLPSPQA